MSRRQKLCDENFHEWKIISSHLITKFLGKSGKFHYATILIANYILNFLSLTKTFCFNGVSLCLFFPNYLLVFSQSFYDFHIYLFMLFFSGNSVYQLFDNNGIIKS